MKLSVYRNIGNESKYEKFRVDITNCDNVVWDVSVLKGLSFAQVLVGDPPIKHVWDSSRITTKGAEGCGRLQYSGRLSAIRPSAVTTPAGKALMTSSEPKNVYEVYTPD